MNGLVVVAPNNLHSSMTCHELAEKLHQMRPELPPADVARLCLLILNQTDDVDALTDDDQLTAAWQNATFRLEAAADQHDAVADELEAMCSGERVEFNPDQLWVLLRALKVQSQILELYTDHPALA